MAMLVFPFNICEKLEYTTVISVFTIIIILMIIITITIYVAQSHRSNHDSECADNASNIYIYREDLTIRLMKQYL